jgi:hypothetical protein
VSQARAATVVLALAAPASLAAVVAGACADSFTPVRLSIIVSPIARRHAPLPITVTVAADPGALDTTTGPVWIRLKLAGECGGTYAGTAGTVLLNRRLAPQPALGQAYTATAHGSAPPAVYGAQTVCAFVSEQGDERQFATSQSVSVEVSQPCTVAAARYDGLRRSLRSARGRRTRRRAAARVAAARSVALKRCGTRISL